VFQCAWAGNSIAIVGVVRDRGVRQKEPRRRLAERTRTCLTRGPVVLVAETASGRRRCSNTRWHTHRPRQRGSPARRCGANPDSSWLGSSVHSGRGPRRHRADMGFRRHRRRPRGDPQSPFAEEDGEMTERISLKGKVAVVTGAGRGVGRAYVELLAERDAQVVVNDLGTEVSGFGKDSAIAEQVADLIRSRGGEAIADGSDVSIPEGGNDLIATTIEHFGRIDLLVNNAGICESQLFEDATLDDFDRHWRVHVGGSVNTVEAAWPHMVAQRFGKIILTTSVSGLFGLRGQATYAAAKCAVVGLMRILAIEGAEHGILVNTISPTAYTRMHPAAGSRTPEAEGRRTMPVEAVAPAIVWLASDSCSETNRIYNVTAGAIQRIAIVMGPGFYDPHLTPESIAENYAKVESIEGFSEPGPFEPGT
jgi:NAD(P)-dependent dehydrogenase (short-subunit alcohol dehydrogenase family)